MPETKHNTRVELSEDELRYVERVADYYQSEMSLQGIAVKTYKRDGKLDTNIVGTIRFALWKLAQTIEMNTAD